MLSVKVYSLFNIIFFVFPLKIFIHDLFVPGHQSFQLVAGSSKRKHLRKFRKQQHFHEANENHFRYEWHDGLRSVQMSPDVSLPQFVVIGHRQRQIEEIETILLVLANQKAVLSKAGQSGAA